MSHTKFFADGTQAPGTDPRIDHIATLDHATGVMMLVESLGRPADPNRGMSQQQCIERCANLDVLGHRDWQLASDVEASAIIDRSRRNPCVDTSVYPRIRPDWHWTSTPWIDSCGKASPSDAWLVYFGYGLVGSSHRGYGGFALAFRRVGQ